jgi:hypothetical protein
LSEQNTLKKCKLENKGKLKKKALTEAIELLFEISLALPPDPAHRDTGFLYHLFHPQALEKLKIKWEIYRQRYFFGYFSPVNLGDLVVQTHGITKQLWYNYATVFKQQRF